MAVVTWKIETLVFWFVFSCYCELMSTKLDLDIFWFKSTQIQFNQELAIVLFAFSSTRLSLSSTRTLPLFRFFMTRDFTVVGSTPSGSLIIFLNSLFSNPSSLSDRCWPCKMIFSPSTSSKMSSGLYFFSGREAILIGLCTANLFWLCWKLVSRACSSEARAISLHRSCKNPKPGTATS